jgi:hypothetical protein
MFIHLLLGATVVTAVPANVERDASSAVTVSGRVPPTAGDAILSPFVAFSIEFSSFPDFAGNISTPNKFSKNLLDNLGKLQGGKPHIRVGGNTQYVFEDLEIAVVNITAETLPCTIQT